MNKALFAFFTSLLLISCVAAGSNSSNESNNYEATTQEEPSPARFSQTAKLDSVLLLMSERFKADFKKGDSDEFLTDLEKVLLAEQTYRDDDLSLYHLIDKKHNIGESYVPKDLVLLVSNNNYKISHGNMYLRPDVEAALSEMGKGAQKDGITLLAISTYRSYQYQKNLFERKVAEFGIARTDKGTAREGISQHQLGTAVDFGEISTSFIETPQGKWLNNHCEEYGWSLSFPKGYEDVTGFRGECWHFRYIGIEACKFQKKWFNDIQQHMIEFIDAWKNYEPSHPSYTSMHDTVITIVN